MILPIQRVPRYEMLLRELVKHTANNHPDLQVIKDSLAEISNIAGRINEGKRKFENLQKVGRIHGYAELVQPDRFLVCELLLGNENKRKKTRNRNTRTHTFELVNFDCV